ncbi:MAG: hypothetical protein V4820_07655 [Pseudomonadota bacterium]
MIAWGPRRAALTLGVTQTVSCAASSCLPAILAGAMAAELGLSIASVFGAFSAALLLQAVLAQASDLHPGPRASSARAAGRGPVMEGSMRWTVILLARLCGLGLVRLMLIQAPHSTAEEHGRH